MNRHITIDTLHLRVKCSLLLIQVYNLVFLLFGFITFRKAKEIVQKHVGMA